MVHYFFGRHVTWTSFIHPFIHLLRHSLSVFNLLPFEVTNDRCWDCKGEQDSFILRIEPVEGKDLKRQLKHESMEMNVDEIKNKQEGSSDRRDLTEE